MQPVYPTTMTKPTGHYAPAIVHNGLVFVSGQLPTDNEGNPVLGTIAEQTQLCLNSIEAILLAANSARSRVLKVNVFVTDIKNWAAVNASCAAFFGEHRPARIVVPSGQLKYGCSVEIDCIAAECE